MNRDLQSSLGWRLCRHARAATVSRGFTVAEVLLAVADPEVRYGSHSGREVRCRGDVCAIVHPASSTVVTVLWRHNDPWTDADVEAARLAS